MSKAASCGATSTSPVIDRVDVHILRVPLKRPYRLAFGDLQAFDTLLVEVTSTDGRSGFGEATLLTGYTHETIDGAWSLARRWADSSVGDSVEALAARTERATEASPFVATAFLTALEMLTASDSLSFAEPVSVPLLALLNSIEEDAIAEEFESLLDDGYRTIKVKVGLAGLDDLTRVRAIQRVVAGRARIRIDANQAFSADRAVEFLTALEPPDIELFEQPCAADDWNAHAAAVRASPVPLMLDESIFSLVDIDRAADEVLAAFVKVKLVKFCSVASVTGAIKRIRERGMQPVLGNGVACDVGCWIEACVAARHIDNAGEMNGYLKTCVPLLANPPRFEAGAIWLPANYRPALDREAIRDTTVATHSSRRALHRIG